MKIAIVIEHFDATRGGAEAITVWLSGQLAAAGHDVCVICHDHTPRFNRYNAASHGASHDAERSRQSNSPAMPDPPAGVRVHRLRSLKLRTGLGFRLFGRRAAAWCAAHSPDIIHSMTVACPGDLYHPHAGVYASIHEQAVASRETFRQAVLKRWMLQFSDKQQTLLKLEHQALASPQKGGARQILCLGAMMLSDFQRHYHVHCDRLIRLDNPLMTPAPPSPVLLEYRDWFRSHYDLAPQDRVVLFAGHDFRRKGLAWAIRTLAITETPWKLLVVGLGKTREYLRLAQSLGLADRVIFVGPTREMSRAYASADALLLPTFYESFGLVALEAMAHGLPVVSTRFLGCFDLVERYHAGTIVNSPTDVQAMARALDALPHSQVDRVKLSNMARKAAQGLDPESYLKRLEAIYQNCVALKRSHD
ncbi:MAG: glycosyltransferase family 4 protein [Phycisphaerae bacterium]|nr:glycosyltransferase family 4 protein [Phycisphaerae bacterium]